MGRLLRDVDNVQLVTALKGLEEPDRAPFFAAMSSRAADGVRDEIEMLTKVKRKDVLAAQKAVIEIARRLRDEGEIALGAGDGEFV
jgi:flagellar motor switch protein FliG